MVKRLTGVSDGTGAWMMIGVPLYLRNIRVYLSIFMVFIIMFHKDYDDATRGS